MLHTLEAYLARRSPSELARDILDVFIVYYLFYRLLLVARGTRAMQVAAGLAIVGLLYFAAQLLGLVTITSLVGALLQSIILLVVVVFQGDIRRALQRVGSRAIWNYGRAQETEVVDEVVEAARELARHRIGALITFEQDANLDEFVGQNKGIDIDAKVSAELLVSLFLPDASNKLHDGAVILRSLRIAKAGVFFPMPEGRVFESSFGSRHRAAIGITEETDAVVVVVSEERGTISFCFNGNIAADLQANQLKDMLLRIMNPKLRKKTKKSPPKRISTAPDEPAVERPVERVSLKSLPPTDEEEAAPPSTQRPRPESSMPPPLRKSSLPVEPLPQRPPDSSPSQSLPIAPVISRPMPKGQEPERPSLLPEEPEENARSSEP